MKIPALCLALILSACAAYGQPADASQAPAAGPRRKPAVKTGRLGGGYKDAKWGMSPDAVRRALPGTPDYETRSPGPEKTMIYDLGEGRKLVCSFLHEQFYRAVYTPIPGDGDFDGANMVFSGLERKFGPGKELRGYLNAENRPLRVVKWNDGISEIEFRMADWQAPEWKEEKSFPGKSVLVMYTNIPLSLKRERLKAEEKKRQEKDQLQNKAQKIENDL